ncbi:YrhA family protein [Pseudomonas sp. PSKL.D1]|uniref:YrhA family protein n=1 Tax=Pseudomonas sp. PSKL.D1 TaxID=3029060 RepID=UPI0023816045|nr:YrhA family protein [Pseudomonas sp. PSKL.D1]WDY55720.1 YrhA family protein [Pseudomonas sp. PSKL.D1]
MNDEIVSRLMSLRGRLSATEMYLGVPASPFEILSLTESVRSELSEELPGEYLDFLRTFDGVSACGAFIYSSRTVKRAGGGSSYGFLEENQLSRDVDFMKDFLVFGDSDQDEYVLDLVEGKYQVRDKQAFFNVYEQFDTFDELLGFIVEHIESQSW